MVDSLDCVTLEDGADRLFRNAVENYQSTLRKILREGRSQHPTVMDVITRNRL
jgi:hypothetical protein